MKTTEQEEQERRAKLLQELRDAEFDYRKIQQLRMEKQRIINAMQDNNRQSEKQVY